MKQSSGLDGADGKNRPGRLRRNRDTFPVVSAADFYKTGDMDCRQTFDRQVFDFDLDALARQTRSFAVRANTSLTNAAQRVAAEALRTADEWPPPSQWRSGTDYDPNEDGPIEDAYADWKRGYIDCATPRVVAWIMERIRRGP
jgi:hypothetical protein